MNRSRLPRCSIGAAILVGTMFSCSNSNSSVDVIADFETSELQGWSITPKLGKEPFRTDQLPGDVVGFEGEGVFNTGHDQVEKTGTIASPEFTISKKYINFLITGNTHYNAEKNCHVRVVIGGEVAKYAPATRFPVVEWGSMDVSEFAGQTASFEIFDNSEKQFIIIDSIHQSDELALGEERTSLAANQRYLLFPVTRDANQYRLRFEKEGDVTEQFVIEMGKGDPDYWAFKDISRYKRKRINLLTYCPTDVPGFDRIRQSDQIPDEESLSKEDERPQFHFTSKTGWINDPNGLVYHEGEWHLMYQHNPYGVIGSLKHWGHAISRDLVHWSEKPSSVVPDDLGSNHSGGAVVDFNNSAGLQTGTEKTLVAFWTAAGHFTTPSGRFTQCISYSTDRGRTWNKYPDNPIIGFMRGRNRDPNVIWHEEAGRWIMSLFLDGNDYAILSSENLIDWSITDEIEMPASECPDLFQLDLDGNPELRKWVFWGGNGNYVIGRFDGTEFDIEGEAHRTHYGQYYAAMTYNNAPDNRVVQVGWIRKWPYPETHFRMQLSIPNELSLRTGPEGHPVLYSYPVKELEILRKESFSKQNISIRERSYVPNWDAELIDMNMVVRVRKGAKLRMGIRGQEIAYSRDENTISHGETSMRLLSRGELQEFRVLVDRASIEVFCNQGEKAIFLPVAMDRENRQLEFSASGGSVEIRELDIYSLDTAWEE